MLLAQALSFWHPVSPLPLYPTGHAPHVRPPTVFVHFVSESHPPLACRHSFTSVQTTPSPTYPAGQAPHVRPPTVLEHTTRGEQPPFVPKLTSLHSSTSTHPLPATTPSPRYPSGHDPQITPVSEEGSAVHVTSPWQPPLITPSVPEVHGFWSAGTSWLEMRPAVTDVLFDPSVATQDCLETLERSVVRKNSGPREARTVLRRSPEPNAAPMFCCTVDRFAAGKTKRATRRSVVDVCCRR